MSRLFKSLFVRQVGSSLVSQVLTILLSVATGAITARVLGPKGKGELSVLLLAPLMLQLVLSFGIAPANTYFAGAGRIPVPKLTRNSVSFALIGSLTAALLAVILILSGLTQLLLPGISKGHVLLSLASLPLILITGNLWGILQGLRRIRTLNILAVMQSILSLASMALFLVWLSWGVRGALLATLAVQATVSLITAGCFGWRLALYSPQWDGSVVTATTKYGMRTLLGNFLQFFNYRLDVFVVNFFVGPAAVGIYSISALLAEALWQLPNAVSLVLSSKSVNSSPEAMNKVTPRVLWAVLATTSAGALAVAVFGRFAIRVFFSDTFGGAYIPMLVLLPGVVLLGGGKILSSDIAGRGYPQYNSFAAALTLVATVVLDLCLIPRMRILGAAIASTISYAICFSLLLGFYRKVSRGKLFLAN